jgi:TPR repeat protein
MNLLARAAAVLMLSLPCAAVSQGLGLASVIADLEADPTRVDYQRLWSAFRAQGEFTATIAGFDVLAGLQYPDGLSVEACRSMDEPLAAAQRTNPVSIALRHAALSCAELAGDSAAASRHEAVIAGLLAAAAGDGRGQSLARPIPITAEVDVVGFAKAAGLEILGAFYPPTSQPRFLPLRVQLSDPTAGTERDLIFDFLDVWLDMSRADPGSAYPIFGISSASRYLQDTAARGNMGAQIGLALRMDRSSRDGREQATAVLRSTITDDAPTGALLLAEACFSAPDLWACDGQEMDVVLDLAEKGNGRALVLLAAAFTVGKGVKREPESAARLLARAEQRLGVVAANEYLADLVAGRELRDDDLSRVGVQALRKAAAAGSFGAMRLLAMAIESGDARADSDGEARQLYDRAAAGGDAAASAVLGVRAIDAEDFVAARAHLQRAVDLGDGSAAGLLAALHSTGRGGSVDRAAARRLRAFAAWRGFSASARMLATHHLPGGLDGIDYDAARRWLEGAAIRGDMEAAARIAELDLFGVGKDADLERAERIYSALAAQRSDAGKYGLARLAIVRNSDPATVRKAAREIKSLANDDFPGAAAEYARMLANGRGVAVDLEAAIAMFRATRYGDSELSDDFVHGMLLLSGPDALQDPKQARALFDRAAGQGRPDELNDIAWRLCVSRNDGFIDPPAGLALSQRVDEAAMMAIDLSTRAACLAATGDFPEALAMQRAALEKVQVEDAESFSRIEAFHARLAAYERGVAWRE